MAYVRRPMMKTIEKYKLARKYMDFHGFNKQYSCRRARISLETFQYIEESIKSGLIHIRLEHAKT